MFVSGAEGLKFKSRVGQVRYSVANGSPSLRPLFENCCVARRSNIIEMCSANSLHTSAWYSEYDEDLVFTMFLGNPNSFLESLLDDSITNSSRSDDVNDVTSTPLRQQQQNFEGWVIPAAPDLSSSYRRTPKPLKSTKKENPMHSLRKTGKPLKQGKTKRLDSAIKSR